jgi:hypothetical protein
MVRVLDTVTPPSNGRLILPDVSYLVYTYIHLFRISLGNVSRGY